MAYQQRGFGYQNKNTVSVLFEHIFHEEKTEQGSRRFVIRVLEFSDSHNLSVGFSRQWLAPNGEWVAAKKGHAYFPVKAWCDLAECLGGVHQQISALFENGNFAGGMGADAQGSYVAGGSYAPNTNVVSGGSEEDAIIPAASTTTNTEPPVAKTSPAGAIGSFGFGAKPRGGNLNGGSVYRRGPAKRPFNQ